MKKISNRILLTTFVVTLLAMIAIMVAFRIML